MRLTSLVKSKHDASVSLNLPCDHMEVIHRSLLRTYNDTKKNARKLILVVTIISAVTDVCLASIALVLASDRKSASIFAFSLECLLDFMSSAIVIWQFSRSTSKRTEYLACVFLGVLFIASGFAVCLRAVTGIVYQEHPIVMPLLILLSSSACSICATLAVLKFWVANHVTRLHCGISAKTVALDGVGSLLSGFCALSLIVGTVVYRRRRRLWFIDSALSTFAGLIMAAIGSRVIYQHGVH
ncbi:transmembrane protein 163-like [Galendromus occidentalis]|uniref:Transmembrane protein 163-like n=1 Tax=Galendromus occidentalis TaxID=34638 RepID=A0AAJ7SE68_9ACAR|nr:transmembrane protein 163-like [Galendromus occidentalis]